MIFFFAVTILIKHRSLMIDEIVLTRKYYEHIFMSLQKRI